MNLINELGLGGYFPDFNSPRYTQDILPVEKISKGMVVTKDKRYLKIAEVKPMNFTTKSPREKDDIISDFASWLAIAPINIQIKIMTRASDPEELINRVTSRFKKDNDMDVQYHIKHYVDLLRELNKGGTISRKFYLIISYEPGKLINKPKTEDEIANILNKNVETIKEYFSRMGNVVVRLGEHNGKLDERQETWLTGKLFYDILNIRSGRDEGKRPKISFKDRTERIYSDTEKVSKNEEYTKPDMPSLLAPTGINTSYPDCIVMDGMYYTYLVISSDGYPLKAYGGWFDRVINLTSIGDSIDMFFHKENSNRVLNEASNKIRFTGFKKAEAKKSQLDYEQIQKAYSSAEYIKDRINSYNEVPFTMTTIITLAAMRHDVLVEKRQAFIDHLSSIPVKVHECKYFQEDAMISTFPLLYLSPKVFQKGKRNVMNRALAAMFPFTSYEMQNEDGFLIGRHLYNDTMCILNPFDTNYFKNANICILGTSGGGKTYTEQLMAIRFREMGTQCFLILPEKAYEYKRACTSLNGTFIKISPSSKDYLNIMELRPKEAGLEEYIQGEENSDTVLVSAKTRSVITFLSLLIPDISYTEEQLIDNALVKTYEKYGITMDNDSIYIDPSDKSKGLKEMPVLGDFINTCKEMYKDKLERVIIILSQFVEGSARSFNHKTNVDLTNKYIAFDVSDLDEKYAAAGMFLVLDFVMGRVAESVLERKMIFIDEGWKLIGAGANEKAAQYVEKLFRTIRGYNGGACISTQNIEDFFGLDGGKFGKAILNNSKIKIVLQLEETDEDAIKDKLKLSHEQFKTITQFKRGDCLLLSNQNQVPLHITGSDYATKLITTDPALVKQVVEEMERNGGILK